MAARNKQKNRRPAPVTSTPARADPAARPVLQRLSESDTIIAALVGVAAAVLFLVTFSSRVALGDAPETVSGVKAIGILHAPGYPLYVLSARVFAELAPIGGWALRVNLFSLV